MKKLIQAFILLITFSFAITPVMAKDGSESSKSKTSQAKKTKKVTKAKIEKKTEKSKKSEKSASTKKSKTQSKPTKKQDNAKKGAKESSKDKDTDSKPSNTSSKSTKETASDTSSSSKKSTKKKTVRSAMTGTGKAKQFKNITVDINRADAATLAYYLVGIGATRAEAIVKYRKKNGKFKSTENLMEVPGIGEAVYAGLKKNISSSKGETSVPKKTTTSTKKK